VGVAQ
jgi:hypothetical protein